MQENQNFNQQRLCLICNKEITDKRSDAIFCSDICRTMYHNSIAEQKRAEKNELLRRVQEENSVLTYKNEGAEKKNATQEIELKQLREQLLMLTQANKSLSEENTKLKEKFYNVVKKLNKINFEKSSNRILKKGKDVNQDVLSFLGGKSPKK